MEELGRIHQLVIPLFGHNMTFNIEVIIMTWVVFIALLIPQIFNFVLENYFRYGECQAAPPSTREFNLDYPLGSVFYSSGPYDFESIIHAGRAYLSPHHKEILVSYKNHDDFLRTRLELEKPYTPCTQTRFGNSIPGEKYYEIHNNEIIVKHCREENP